MISTQIFQTLAASAVGLRTPYPIRDAGVVADALPPHLLPEGFDRNVASFPLTYLDSTASTKMIRPVRETLEAALAHYANSHSVTHGPARISTHAFEKAHETVMGFVNAPKTHAAVFVGNGTTGAVNRLARILFSDGRRGGRDTVIFSGMEHHANILPWLKHAPYALGVPVDPSTGTLSLERVEESLKSRRHRTRLLAVTNISNVTGIVNDVAALTRLAHEYGAEIFVDAAQTAAHKAIDMAANQIDYLAFSGHKVYAPGSPGVLILPESASPRVPDEMGGGIVLSVNLDNYLLSDRLPDREEAGTPNILGAVLLARALKTLQGIGMEAVWAHEAELTRQLLAGLGVFEEITVYGDTNFDRTPRAGVVSFDVKGLHHAIVGQALADYFNIAVRNECFCAHPYVKALKGVTREELEAFEAAVQQGDHSGTPGMVRASLGIYTTEDDIERFHAAIDWVVANAERLRSEYEVNRDGVAIRRDGWRIDPESFGIL
ncbi:MAG TPA: aminotransferase class V-fold PLP-dependent enzyme [bacterium]|nr:aminotransferase class V-fold PLP-dependent enzyme [bacterium]